MLLLITAAAVFLAVAWSLIGVAGQVGVMAAATVLAGAVTVRLARRQLRSTAEAGAVLTVGLAVVDVAAAYELNLAGLQAVNGAGYAAVLAAVLAAAFAAVSMADRRVHTFQIAAVAAAAVAPSAGLIAADVSFGVSAQISSLVFLLVTVCFAALGRILSAQPRSTRISLGVAAAAYLALTWVAALIEVFTDPLAANGLVCAMVAALAAVGAGAVAGLGRGLEGARTRPVLAAAAIGAAALTVVGIAGHASPAGLAATVLGTTGLLTAIAASGRPLRSGQLGTVLTIGHLVAAGAVITLADRTDIGSGADAAPLTAALTALTVCAGVTAVWRSFGRPLAVGYGAGCGAAAAAVATLPAGPTPAAVAMTCAAMIMAGLAGWRRTHTEEIVLASTAVITTLYAIGLGSDAGPEALAAVLGFVGLTALGYGILPARGYVAVVGVGSCSASIWALLLDRQVDAIEAYSLPLAGLAALVGYVRMRRQPASPSWLTFGPALSAALLPSAAVSLDDAGLTRPLLVLVVGAGMLITGMAVRWQAPVLVGTLAVTVVAVSQLAPYAVGLPRWLSLGSVGLGLVVLGARYERRRQDARRVGRWVAALH
ncbi:MAG TPA: hypothetical protein VFJ97_10665 [Dermatophilaceae bacterium]|nr:hypothetical protein [Dermatophilaceae bacterium]